MNCNVGIKEIRLDEQRILNKVTNNDFGLVAATEWKKLIDPFTPRRTGRTVESAEVNPWQIKYDPINQKDQYWLWEDEYINGYPADGSHYGKEIYYNTSPGFFHTSFRFPAWCPAKFHNPLSTGKWDKAAEQAGKKKELYSILNAHLRTK